MVANGLFGFAMVGLSWIGLTLGEESFVFLKEAIPLALVTKVECSPTYLL